MKRWLGWVISAASGLILWSYAKSAQGTQEPWDGADYWTLYFPIALVLSLVLGFAFPDRSWRWPLAVMFAQLPVMLIGSDQAPTLIGAGIIMLLILSAIGAAFAWAGAGIRRLILRSKA